MIVTVLAAGRILTSALVPEDASNSGNGCCLVGRAGSNSVVSTMRGEMNMSDVNCASAGAGYGAKGVRRVKCDRVSTRTVGTDPAG